MDDWMDDELDEAVMLGFDSAEAAVDASMKQSENSAPNPQSAESASTAQSEESAPTEPMEPIAEIASHEADDTRRRRS